MLTLNEREVAALNQLLREYLFSVSPEEDELTKEQLAVIFTITGLRP